MAAALALYAGAKLLESLDPEIYALGHIVSGHTLKHLAAAGAAYFILLMLQCRTAASCPTPSAPLGAEGVILRCHASPKGETD